MRDPLPDDRSQQLGPLPADPIESSRPRSGLGRPGLELLIISFVVLFQELAFIRWIPAQVRVVAYFPNLVLISAFLGLGIGSLRSRYKSLLWLWPVALVALVGVTAAMSQVAFTARGTSDYLWLLYVDLPPGFRVVNGVRLPLVATFFLSALTFVPLGQAIGQRLKVFRDGSKSLWGYSFDLAGSLLGVVGFALASFLGTFPVAWFATFLLLGGVMFVSRRATRLLWLSGAAVVILSVHATERSQWYSPYYSLKITSDDYGEYFSLLTNGSLHQIARRVQTSDPISGEKDEAVRRGFNLPYEVLGRPPGKVLVLGAGTGNDVAVLLERGAEHIDAVEIDPVIAGIGKKMHPNRPYSSPRVTVHTTDARNFLNQSEEVYDLVVFGTLDSMTRLSALSNVRLDNFVYTVEAIEAAKARLAPDGGIVMYFMVGEKHIGDRLWGMLAKVFNRPPAVVEGNFALFNQVYMAGPAFDRLHFAPEKERALMAGLLPSLTLPTDDWPYLYLKSASVSPFYLSLMAIFLLIAGAGVLAASPEMRSGLSRGRRGVDLEMFLFGMAFLLIETHFVTAMSLVWGVTWLTSAVVFASILATILVGTLLVARWTVPWRVAAFGLVASLLAGYVIPLESLLIESVGLRLLASMLFVGTPVLFAAICFALVFETRAEPDQAFGWNVLGAVVGGLLEFFSMSLGIRAMVLLATVAYLTAFLVRSKAEAPRPSGVRTPAETPAEVEPAVA